MTCHVVPKAAKRGELAVMGDSVRNFRAVASAHQCAFRSR